MTLRKKEDEIDGWKVIELLDLNEESLQEITINNLGWYLIIKRIINIWWKDGYYAYFNSGSSGEIDIKEKTVINCFHVGNVLYLKGREYHKYLEIDNQTFETRFIDEPKLNTTEKTYVVIFDFKSDYMDMILETIKNKLVKK